MLISHDRRFLFVHVPKTAGTSITNCIRPFADDPASYFENRFLERLGIRVNLFSPYRRKRFRTHATALDVKRNLPADVYDRLYKFTFVRNPWSMLASLYRFIPSRPRHRKAKIVAAMTFDEFVDTWTLRPEVHQKRWVCDSRGDVIVDYIGRYESLSHDFQHVCNHLGIECLLPHDNRGPGSADYRELYSKRLETLVADRLSEDIDLFEYQFDGDPVSGSSREASSDGALPANLKHAG